MSYGEDELECEPDYSIYFATVDIGSSMHSGSESGVVKCISRLISSERSSGSL